MKAPRILIAGIGNIFFGDDAFGCEVVKKLFEKNLSENVRLMDFGIRGFDLAYALMDGLDAAILIDATPRGGAPGTVYLIEPDLSEIESRSAQRAAIDTHNINPLNVLTLVKTLGGDFGKIYLVGCEPLFTGEEDIGFMGLSAPVTAAVAEASELIERLVRQISNKTA